MAFTCPSCGHRTRVYDSRENGNKQSIRRFRSCRCGHRFTTYEITAEAYSKLANVRDRAAEIDAHRRAFADACTMPVIPEDLGLRPNTNRRNTP